MKASCRFIRSVLRVGRRPRPGVYGTNEDSRFVKTAGRRRQLRANRSENHGASGDGNRQSPGAAATLRCLVSTSDASASRPTPLAFPALRRTVPLVSGATPCRDRCFRE